ncbi:sensor histidine kinase [Novispirillum sp. DQ9]|uniref:sensor histidine kinase n=1 Tax=Novispirillum sp. DQ9 TaxID=3398612 RepID=UPI003C7DA5C1
MLRSLRLRLLLGAALWVTVALALAGVVLHQLFAFFVEGQLVQRLEADVEQLAGRLAVTGEGRPVLHMPPADPLFDRPLSGLYWQIETPRAAVLRSRSLWDGVVVATGPLRPLTQTVGVFEAVGPGGTPLVAVGRVVIHPDLAEPLRLVVARDATVMDAPLSAFAWVLAVSLGVLALGLIAAAWAQVGFGLRPLRRLRAALADIRAERAERLSGAWPQEVQPLVDDLNGLLGDNVAMVQAAQTQAGNLAHALKTPLSVIANEAAALSGGGAAEAAALIGQQVEAMRRHVDHHLARARAQAASEGRGVRTPVAASLERLTRVLGRLHGERGVVLEIAAGPPPPDFKGDRQTLEEILGNLLDNACKWARGRVRVGAAAGDGGTVVLTVEDDGPGIPADRLDEALRRGRRLDETAPGSGLGLSIVDDLTRAAGGALDLGAAPDLGGLRARVRLPGAPAAGPLATPANPV